MDLTMNIPSIITVLFLTFIRLDKVSGVSSCITCTSSRPGSSRIPNSAGCLSTNSSVISLFASNCNAQFAPNYYLPDIVGCQTIYILGANNVTVEKVDRGCALVDSFLSYGVTPDLARTPAGMCFSLPLAGVVSCICASRDDCNAYPFVGKDSSGKFVATALQPDANGNSNTNSNGNIANGNGSDKAGTADDQSKVTASGTNANGSQDPISEAMKNHGKTFYLVLAFLFVFCLDFGLVMF